MQFNLLKSHFILLLLILSCLTDVRAQEPRTQQEAFTWTMHDNELQWGPCPEFMPESCSIAVLQGDPAQPNADVFFKMQGNTTVPQHWHQSAERMVLVSGEMQVEYESQNPEILKPGTYAYGPSERRHRAACLSEEPCVLFIAFEEPVDAFPAE